MAMYDVYGPTSREIGEDFRKAAGEGQRYLVLLTETLADPMLVTDIYYTRAVASAEDIPQLIRDEQQKRSYGTVHLSGIFDLSGQYEAQAANSYDQQLRTHLPASVQNTLAADARARQKLQEQQEWARRPWYERLFIARPL